MQAMFNAPTIEMVPFEVEYREGIARPTVHLSLLRSTHKDAFEDIQNALLTKSAEWRDQAEQRLIRVGISGGHVEFPAASLCGVVLGYDAPPELQGRRERLIALCREREEPIPLYQARISATNYAIDLHRLEANPA
jgi:hypothetical protein